MDIRQEIQQYLDGHLYVCTRHESAWQHGTMGLDDFEPAWGNEDVIESLVDIAKQFGAKDDNR